MIAISILILVVGLLVYFFTWKHKQIKRLREIRDNFDFTTPEGKLLIKAYNQKINELNGYNVWN